MPEKFWRNCCFAIGMPVHHIAMRNGDRLWELRIPLGERLGLTMGGYVAADGKLVRERYLPYIDADGITSTAECMIERHVDNEVYSGLIDDMRIGISLIFRLTNVAEYRQQRAKTPYKNAAGREYRRSLPGRKDTVAGV